MLVLGGSLRIAFHRGMLICARVTLMTLRLLGSPAAVQDERRAGHQRWGIRREKHDRTDGLTELAEPDLGWQEDRENDSNLKRLGGRQRTRRTPFWRRECPPRVTNKSIITAA
jgi:hypothetical protein